MVRVKTLEASKPSFVGMIVPAMTLAVLVAIFVLDLIIEVGPG
jgi:hypothetical protein